MGTATTNEHRYSIEHRYNSEADEWHALYSEVGLDVVGEVRAANDDLGWQKYRHRLIGA